MSHGKTSPWVYIGCGCAVLVGLVLGAVVGLGWWGYREARQLEEEFKDPVARAEKTRAILPHEELPEGYHPLGAFSIPLLMDMAIFSDREPVPGLEDGREFDQRGFFYMKIRRIGDNDEELRRFLRGEGEEPEAMRQAEMDFEARETVAQGTVRAGGGTLLYQARRGSLRAEQGQVEGIANVFLVDCPDDDGRLRMGIWFGPDPQPEKAADEADWSGSPADPATLTRFAEHFTFCG